MTTATIYKIDRLNTHNGEGYRTVIYFKGCPLHCTWCHNPEGMSTKKEVWFNAVKCIACGECVLNCPEKAVALTSNGIEINRNTCTGCQICTTVCPSKAMEKIGETIELNNLMQIILQDKILFDSSGGGITATGGEPGLFPDFIEQLFQKCQENNIHTAFDTSGMVSEKALEKILPYTNLVFLDLKLMNEDESIKHSGLSLNKLEKTVQTIKKSQKINHQLKVEIRTPLVPGITDTNENLNAILQFISEKIPSAKSWELCMFNDLCEDKYTRMNKEWKHQGQQHTEDDYHKFQELISNQSIKTNISGFTTKKAH